MNLLPEVRSDIDEWINRITCPRKELGGHAICPFASKKYTLSDGFDVPETIKSVHICVLSKRLKQGELKRICNRLNEHHDDLVFLPDHKKNTGNINGLLTGNGKHNLILIQPKRKLTETRKTLVESDYYSYWSKKYLKEILKEDYEVLD